MEIIGTTIIFKSDPENYLKEKYGAKPNTVRTMSDIELCDFHDSFKNLKTILIVNNDTRQSFERVLTDITEWNITDDIKVLIFSWKNYKLIDDC